MNPDPALLRRYRYALAAFLFGLVASGLTAFPLLAEIRTLAGWLGITAPAHYPTYSGLAHRIAYVGLRPEETLFVLRLRH